MPFFDPIPEPDAEQIRDRPTCHDYPGHLPEHWLPGLGGEGVVLARSATTAVFLRVDAVFPRGLALSLDARLHPDDLVEGEFFGFHHDYVPAGRRLRVGLEWPDGSRVVAEARRGPEADSAPRLSMTGGGGGGLTFSWNLWLHPLPPAGPVTVHVLWESRGIEETSVVWDLAPIVARAGDAVELWPLPPPPEEYGWTAYSPMDGGSATIAALSDDGEGES